MAANLDELGAKLLNALQEGVPLVDRPFASIAQSLGLSEAEVLTRVSAMKQRPRGAIRQISAIFDSKTLGYQSSLVAAKVDEDRLDAAAAEINRHPGVSHNYRRNNAFNLWYTLAVPPDSTMGLQKTVDILHRRSGALATRMLPTLKLFKIGVKFDTTGGDLMARDAGPAFSETQRDNAANFTPTDADKRMIRVLQQDLPVEPRPFDAWAAQAAVPVPELLAAAQRYIGLNVMRRFSAVLRHREVGFSANAMGVWAVPQDQVERVGKTAATFAAVSHCYLRPSYPDWPYNIFTMVHAPDQEACEAVLAEISRATGIKDYSALYSTKEYKKTRVQYFLPDVEEWEEGNAEV